VMVGDQDQLASVEAGSVLGDICNRQAIHSFSNSFRAKIEQLTESKLQVTEPAPQIYCDMQDCITILQESYRFAAQGGIGGLSRAVNRGDSKAALAQLIRSTEKSVAWRSVSSDTQLVHDISGRIVTGYRKYLTLTSPVSAMKEFVRFQLLCALKIGPSGAIAINRLAEEVLNREGLISCDPRQPASWYRGRPVMITKNDYNLGLFNGDIGITLPDPESSGGGLCVFFPDAAGNVKRIPTHRLADCETVFAMTVHKSQGSEFDHVILLLPQTDYPLLTRELIYTGVTRARQSVSIWGAESVLKVAIARKIERTSGLRDALWT
jgi:exodeoxyribonuclease V alpha subunit